MFNAILSHSYRLVIPTTIFNRIAPAATVEALRVEVKTAFARAFGGYTETAGTGGYVAESGELIEEQVYTVEACFSEPDDDLVVSLAERIKAKLQQEAVMIRKDNEVYFV